MKMTIKKSKVTTIRFNKEEQLMIDEMGKFLGLDSRSAIVKACFPYAKQRIDSFLKEFEDVIRPLKMSEIDSLITTMAIIAKKMKKVRQAKYEEIVTQNEESL